MVLIRPLLPPRQERTTGWISPPPSLKMGEGKMVSLLWWTGIVVEETFWKVGAVVRCCMWPCLSPLALCEEESWRPHSWAILQKVSSTPHGQYPFPSGSWYCGSTSAWLQGLQVRDGQLAPLESFSFEVSTHRPLFLFLMCLVLGAKTVWSHVWVRENRNRLHLTSPWLFCNCWFVFLFFFF